MIGRRTFIGAAAASAALAGAPLAAQGPGRRPEPAAALRILIGGDVSHGESYARPGVIEGAQVLATRGYDYSLLGLAPLLRRADYTILNLETPVTDLKRSPLSEAGKDFLHWTHPDKAPDSLAAWGVDAVSLANNHTLDYGLPGLEQSFDALRRHGISWFGAGDNEADAALPLIRAFRMPSGRTVRIALFGQFEYRESYDKKYNFYAAGERGGAHLLSVERFADQVRDYKARFPDLFVIAYPHWGSNYAWRSEKQARLGRGLVDAGADMVIGHHGHTLQEVERYKGKWILYGIGNFMFNSRGRFAQYPQVLPYSLAVELLFADGPGAPLPETRLYPILSDNVVTEFQPRIAGPADAAKVFDTLARKSAVPGLARMATRSDEAGGFTLLPPPTRA